jgi:hypothetical protein
MQPEASQILIDRRAGLPPQFQNTRSAAGSILDFKQKRFEDRLIAQPNTVSNEREPIIERRKFPF